MKTKKHYNLTKKELSFLNSIEEPVRSIIDGSLLSKPVVLAINPSTKNVVCIYSLSHFKYKVNKGYIIDGFEYHLRIVF